MDSRRARRVGLIYLDSCIIIDATLSTGPNGDRARMAIANIDSERRFVTSALVDLECMIRPLRGGNRGRIDAVRSSLARFAHVNITPRAYELAAHLRAVHGLKTPDALHTAAASLNGCIALWTSDRELLGAMPSLAVNPYES